MRRLRELAAVLFGLSAISAAQDNVLARNGVATSEISMTSKSLSTTFAATELQKFLRQMSRAPISMALLSKRSRKVKIELIDDWAMPASPTRPRSQADEFTIDATPGKIVIRGGKRGVIYGVYYLLDDVLGCRWYTPTINRIPSLSIVKVPLMHLHERPAFEYREPYFTEALDRYWAVRNRCNGNGMDLDDSVGGRVSYGKFVHTFNELLPPEQYFASHPEYYSLVDGQRRNGYYQLCLTNPEVLKLSIERVEQWIRENPSATIFSISQNDTDGHCQCDTCRAIEIEEGAPSGVVLRFVNQVAGAIEKMHPNVLIDTLAYQWSEKPPRFVRPRRNVRVRLAPIGACFGHGLAECDQNREAVANLRAWAKITRQLYIWHYTTNFANYLQPLPNLDEIADDLKLFHDLGVVGVFDEGDYASGGGGDLAGLKSYLMAKLMWNPDRPAKPIIDDYLQGVYGAAAPFVAKWINLSHAEVRCGRMHARIYDAPEAGYLPEYVLKAGQAALDKAEAAVQNDAIRLEQVQRLKLGLQFVQLMRMKRDDPARPRLIQTLKSGIEKFGITQLREGEPITDFWRRIGA